MTSSVVVIIVIYYLVLGTKFVPEEKIFKRKKLKFVFDRNWFNTKPHILISV